MSPLPRQHRNADPATDYRDSFGHMLLVFALVGTSLAGVGAAVTDALAVGRGLRNGLLVGTVGFVALWLGGFRPSLRAAVGYFLTEGVCSLLLVLVVPAFVAVGPWTVVGIRVASVSLAGGLVFTDPGRHGREWLRRRAMALVKRPPREESNVGR